MRGLRINIELIDNLVQDAPVTLTILTLVIRCSQAFSTQWP